MSVSPPSPPHGIKPGTLLQGGWVSEVVLREGPTGVELRCHHQDDPTRKAAIKIFRDTYPDAWRRFQREAHILSRVDHPHLLKAELTRLEAAPPYLVLQLREGPDLRSVLERAGALPVVQTLRIGRDLANLLAHLHARAIYHRDLQPANVLLTPAGAVVVQMGIAREEGFGVLTNPGTQLGDVRYAPPEWAKPEQLLPQQWDLYALGLTLHAVLTGEEPFYADPNLHEADRAVRLTKLKRATPHLDPGEGFSEDVRQLIRSLTDVEPAQRPATAREVHFRLRELISEAGGDPAASAGPAPDLPPPTEAQRAAQERLIPLFPPAEEPPPTIVPPPRGVDEDRGGFMPVNLSALDNPENRSIASAIAAIGVFVVLSGGLLVTTLLAIYAWMNL